MAQKTLEEMGLTQFEITLQVILEPAALDRIQMDSDTNKRVAKAVAAALGLGGEMQFRVQLFKWDFSPDEESG